MRGRNGLTSRGDTGQPQNLLDCQAAMVNQSRLRRLELLCLLFQVARICFFNLLVKSEILLV